MPRDSRQTAALRPVAGFPDLRLLRRLRRSPGFTGGLSPLLQGSLSRSELRTLRDRLSGGYPTCPSRSLRNPERHRGRSGCPVEPTRPSGRQPRPPTGMPEVRSPPPIVLRHSYPRSWPSKKRPTGDGGGLSRRQKPAWFGLTMRSLSQASLLGRLGRASRVPFRGSYLTTGFHPPAATPQGLTPF